VDAANTFTYTLVAGTGSTDNAAFNISGSNLRITSSPDFETKNSYSVRVRTTDQGSLTYEKAFTITINDVNEAPTDIALSAFSINENVPGNSTVGLLSSTDVDAANTFTYSLVAGTGSTDNAAFNISGSNLRITSSPDFETKSSYSVRVRTTDQGSLTYEKAFTITISDVNEAPTDIALSASSINENVPANSTVGSLSSTDVDAANTFTYTLVAGTGSTDNAAFNISGSNLRITSSPDFETKNSYSVRVRTTDQGSLTYEKEFSITINDMVEIPVVTTQAVSSIASTTATGNGNIASLGSPNPTAHGVCWNTTGAPTVLDSKVNNGAISSTGAFTASMTGLSANTTYYVRAYVTNISGTSYGAETTFTTLKIQLTITDPVVVSKVYDNSTNASLYTTIGVVSGILPGDNVTVNIASSVFDTKNVGSGKTVTVTYALSGTLMAKYIAPVASVLTTGRITAKPLTITGLVAHNKEYNGDRIAVVSGGVLQPGIMPDDVSVTMPTSGTFTDKHAGLHKSVSVESLSLLGADKDNYSLIQPTSLFADISPKPLSITGLIAKNKVYDGSLIAKVSGGLLQNVIIPDDVSVNMPTNGSFINKNVGKNKPVGVSNLVLTGADKDNYLLTQPGGLSADIEPISLRINGLVAENKEYDGTIKIAIKGGELHYVLSEDDVKAVMPTVGYVNDKNVGNYKFVNLETIQLLGADKDNYVLPQPIGLWANILPRNLTITGLVARDKEYDGTVEAQLSGGELQQRIYNEDVSVTMPASGTFESKNVGSGIAVSIPNLILIGKDISNYSLVQPIGITATIRARELTIEGAFSVNHKPFDGTTSATIRQHNLTLKGVLENETVTLNPVAEFASAAVGNDIHVYLCAGSSLTGPHKENYMLSLVKAPTTKADITVVTSMADVSKSEITVYPNPFMEYIYFKTDLSVSNVSISNIAGKILFENIDFSDKRIQTSHLPKGIYVVTFELQNKKKLTYKVVK